MDTGKKDTLVVKVVDQNYFKGRQESSDPVLFNKKTGRGISNVSTQLKNDAAS